jgi:ABC-type glycerol-3-phosphate transport system substrate-binding protein
MINSFPSVEPPPSSEEGSVSQISEKSPFDVLEGQTAQDPNQKNGYVQQRGLPEKNKKTKLLLALLAGMVLLIIILFIVLIFKNKPSSLIGTKGEIVWWGIENDFEVVSPIIDEFQKNNPNVRVTYVKQSEKDYRERLTSAIASGKAPDVYEIHNSWIPMFKKDLTLAPSTIIDIKEYKKSFYPVITSDLTTKDGIYAVPLEYDALTLFYNEDIFNSGAKVPPKTWDDVLSLSQELTQKNQTGLVLQSGIALGQTKNVDHWPEVVALMMIQNGASLSKPKSQYSLDAVNFFRRFSLGGVKTWDSTLPPSTIAFARGKLAMYFGPARRAIDIHKENPSLRFRTSLVPQLPKNNPTDPNYTYASYWVEGVWKRSKNSDTAWSFLKYISSPESLEKMNKVRKEKNIFEKAYPRQEMSILQKEDKILGSVIELAPVAKSWYLYQNTFDGPTGLNTQMDNVLEDFISSMDGGSRQTETLADNLPAKISEILVKYGIK